MEKDELIQRIKAAFRDKNTTRSEWQALMDEMLEMNKKAETRGEERPFPTLGYLEMVGMMADPTGYPDGEKDHEKVK